MRAKIVALVAVVLTLFLAFATSAQADFEPYGAGGGTPFKASCPANQYVAGFFGRVGSWLDDIGLICAPTVGTTTFDDPVQLSQFFGGLGGGVTSTQCEKGTVVKYVHYFVQYDRANSNSVQYIRGISIDCAHADGTTASNKCFGVCHDGEQDRSFVAQFGAGGYGQVDNNCAPGLMTGLNGRTNQYVVALGALCGPLPKNVTQVAANNGKPIKITGGSGTAVPDQDIVCTGGGGMKVTPVPTDASADFVSFAQAAQGASAAPPAAGQCAWSTGPIGGAFNKLILTKNQPKAQDLFNAAQSGGSFTAKARTLGAGIIMVTGIENVQGAAAAANASTPPAGSGYVLVCQGGNGMRVSGGGVTLGGPSFTIVTFKAASEAGNSGQLDPGSCAWIDRPLRAAEPLVMDVPNDLQGSDALKQAIKHGSFEVHANNTGKALLVNQIDKVQGNGGGSGGGSLSVNINIGGQKSGSGNGASGGGSVLQAPIAEGDDGNGTAATIAKAVNVHTAASGGSVLGSLAAGTPVTDLGCSKGWCHIAFQGGQGWVAQSFLNVQ